MPGPGGGPSRRSHTKSRQGCETCKKRHIRCDETKPHCRNCTKHKSRCPYMDLPVPAQGRSMPPQKANMNWTPQIETAINNWQQLGIAPLKSLVGFDITSLRFRNPEQLRLLYHIVSIYEALVNLDVSDLTIWARHFPTILQLASANDSVRSALLAFAASHLYSVTGCPLVEQMIHEHYDLAFGGFIAFISGLTRANADAALATSFLLSWVADNWANCTNIMQGTDLIVNFMQVWKHDSAFAQFFNETNVESATVRTIKENLDELNKTIKQLERAEAYLNQSGDRMVAQLCSFVKGLRRTPLNETVGEQFARLAPLRNALFWLPYSLSTTVGVTPNALVCIAHYYAVALQMDRFFPESGPAYFGSFLLAPTEEIARRVTSLVVTSNWPAATQTLLDFPLATVHEFRERMVVRKSAANENDARQVISNQFAIQQQPAAPFGVYAGNPAFTISAEDLSLPSSGSASPLLSVDFDVNGSGSPPMPIRANVGPNGSPLMLMTANSSMDYLNVPSPGFGAYSPASLTFDESYTPLTEPEDYVPLGGVSPYGLEMSAGLPSPNVAFTDGSVSPYMGSHTSLPHPESPMVPATGAFHHRNTSSLSTLWLSDDLYSLQAQQPPKQEQPEAYPNSLPNQQPAFAYHY